MSDEIDTPVDEFDALFGDESETDEPAGQYITIRTTSGDARYVEVEGPISVADLLAKANLLTAGVTQVWMNDTQVEDMTTVVPVGGTVMLVSSVKGG